VGASKCNQSENKGKDPRKPIKPPDRISRLMRKAIIRDARGDRLK
jgi:hypothetical protein